MSKQDSSLSCPSCQGQLEPKILACSTCNLRVEGDFHFNEFATLTPDDLHFLRIFVQSEGKVRDMESALGLSYPTIRTRITELKNKIFSNSNPTSSAPQPQTVKHVLEQLESKALSFDEAMMRIRKLKGVKP